MEHRVRLREEKRENGSSISLTAEVTPEGALVLRGYDYGPLVEGFWGGSDYEFWRTVDKEWVPQVLLHLMKERFSGDGPFTDWLRAHNIPSQFDNWISFA